MTEAEWLGCDNPLTMVEVVSGSASERKLRLFACACARLLWANWNGSQRAAVVTAERVAEGTLEWGELASHRGQNMGVASGFGSTAAAEAIRRVLQAAQGPIAVPAVDNGWEAYSRRLQEARQEATARIAPPMCALVRCVFAPYRGTVEHNHWRAEDVLAVARAAYDEWSPSDGALSPLRLSILADALTDAGCADEGLLAHLRSPGKHVRGCWALDLVLGKE